MAVTRRGRQTQPTDREIEEFAARAEQPSADRQEGSPVRTRAAREPKVAGINFRMTEKQMELLRTAAVREDISQQKILERIVWPALEARHGNAVQRE